MNLYDFYDCVKDRVNFSKVLRDHGFKKRIRNRDYVKLNNGIEGFIFGSCPLKKSECSKKCTHQPLRYLKSYFQNLIQKTKKTEFYVNIYDEIWGCDHCKKSGDIITYISLLNKISYLEAAKYIAKKYNIEIPNNLNFNTFDLPTPINLKLSKDFNSIPIPKKE